MRKRTAALLLSMVLFAGLCTVTSSADSTEGLYADDSAGMFTVNDTNGFHWQSSPVSGGFDEQAPGMEKTTQRSVMLIRYLDESGIINEVNSFIETQNIKESGDGYVAICKFDEAGIIVPLKLTYQNHTLTAFVDTSQIREASACRLLTVTVLPYFGAGGSEEEGYLLIPDGSGAIVEFGVNNAHTKSYEKPVYGENPVLYKNAEKTVEQQIYLPVFGIKRGENALLGIMTQGDAVSSIRANVSSSYFTAAATFNYRQADTSHLQEGSSKEKEVEIVPKAPTKSDFEVTYLFLQGAQSDYIGMANAYRDFLKLEGKTASGVCLDLSFTATAQIAKSFLGIPYTGTEILTKLSDIGQVLDGLEASGCAGVNVSVNGALSGGRYGKLPKKAAVNGKVGKLKEYQSLKERLVEMGGGLYLTADFQRIYRSGNGVSFASGAARDVAGAISSQYRFYPESYGKNESRVWKLANAKSLGKITAAFAKSARKNGVSVGLLHNADELYGDYRLKDPYDRAAMLAEQLKAFEQLYQASGPLYAQGANGYILPQAGMLSGVPTRSSQYDMFTRDVPFYQAVLHGLADYSAEAVNVSGNEKDAILQCVEYGAAVRFDLICRGEKVLNRTSETWLFSSLASDHSEPLMDTGKRLWAFYRANAGSRMTAHTQLAQGVFRTEYENGNASIVNHSDMDYEASGTIVAAGDYALLTGGGGQ